MLGLRKIRKRYETFMAQGVMCFRETLMKNTILVNDARNGTESIGQ
jgi:hypothetical protein